MKAELMDAIWNRDNFKCTYCGKTVISVKGILADLPNNAATVDLKFHWKGKDLDNLITSCKECKDLIFKNKIKFFDAKLAFISRLTKIRNNESVTRGNLPRHRKIKVWERDNWTCMYCGIRIIDTGKLGVYPPNEATVDHVLDRCNGSPNRQIDLVACCRECNVILSRANDLTTFEERKYYINTVRNGRPTKLM